jgi:hypothetical protein
VLSTLVGCRSEAGKSPAHAVDTTRSAVSTQRTCGASTTLDGSGVGALRIGRPVDEIRRACTVLWDTTGRDIEGNPARTIGVRIGPDSVRAEVVNDSIWRLTVTTPTLRTADSLGVGTPLSRLLEAPNAHGLSGEGAVFVTMPEHCGMSFELSTTAPTPRSGWTRAALQRLPKATRVTRVLVFGCAFSSDRPPT